MHWNLYIHVLESFLRLWLIQSLRFLLSPWTGPFVPQPFLTPLLLPWEKYHVLHRMYFSIFLKVLAANVTVTLCHRSESLSWQHFCFAYRMLLTYCYCSAYLLTLSMMVTICIIYCFTINWNLIIDFKFNSIILVSIILFTVCVLVSSPWIKYKWKSEKKC